MSNPGPVPKYLPGFSYICSKYYELGVKLDETELEKESYHASNNKVKLFRENIVVIEKKWFADMNLPYEATFLTPLIKNSKSIIIKNYNFPHDTRQRIWKIVINNGCNTHIVHILLKKRDVMFIFKGIFLIRLPNPV